MAGFAMDKYYLFTALLLAVIAAVQGAVCVHRGIRSRWTVLWLLLSFAAQMVVLSSRSQLRGSCPLGDTGEILVFSAWSLTMCYLAVGSVYRLSLLGVFTAPLVSFLLAAALIPGFLEAEPPLSTELHLWQEFHAAFSVLAYGALGLAAVAAVMFLVLNQQLKDAHLSTGLFRKLPPIRELVSVVQRLLILGFTLLSFGVVFGLMMKSQSEAVGRHLLVAFAVWVCYAALLLVSWRRGLPPRKLALATVALFVLSLTIFILL